MKDYIAFDIEVAKPFPDNTDWRDSRPLGITCAAFAEGEGRRVHVDVELGVPQMTKNQCKLLVEQLIRYTDQGKTLVTHNGLGFDLQVLAEESGMWDECRHLALAHADIMYHVLCVKGHPVSLNSVALGMRVGMKSENVDPTQIPLLWNRGEYDRVLDYLRNDVTLTLRIAQRVAQEHQLLWISLAGKARGFYTEEILTVEEANQLPEPYTGWMTNPLPRSYFMEWTDAAERTTYR